MDLYPSSLCGAIQIHILAATCWNAHRDLVCHSFLEILTLSIQKALLLAQLVFSAESSYTNGLSANDLLKEASTNAQVQLQKEQKDIEQSLSAIVDVQVST